MFDPSIYETGGTIGSVWEETATPYSPKYPDISGSEVFDVLIIGGGLTGLSAALTLTQDHQLSVGVLEAGKVGGGASGRNGGFCNVSPIKTFAGLIRTFGHEQAKEYIDAQFEAVRYVRSLTEMPGIDASAQIGGTFEVAHSRKAFAALQKKAELMKSEFGLNANIFSADEFDASGHASPRQHGALKIPEGFTLNPLALARGIARSAETAGVKIFEGSRVLSLSKDGDLHRVTTQGGVTSARKVIFATNGYTPDRMTRILSARFMPVISAIVATRPLTNDELARQAFTTNLGCSTTHGSHYYYHVLPNRRLLFGGPGDVTGKPRDAVDAYERLAEQLGRWLPEFEGVEIDYQWRGLVCTSQRFAPSAGIVDEDPSLLYGLGYQGNGVASATWTGRQLAQVAAGALTSEQAFPTLMRGLPRKFPLAFLRPLYVRAAYAAIGLQDKEDER